MIGSRKSKWMQDQFNIFSQSGRTYPLQRTHKLNAGIRTSTDSKA